MMNRREVVREAIEHRAPPYVPWSFGFTREAKEKLIGHYGPQADLEEAVGNHLLRLGSDIGLFEAIGPDRVRDMFGVVWDRRIDKDIGAVQGCLLPEPTLASYRFPNPLDPRFFAGLPERIARHGDRFRVYQVGFSLWERAWSLRGMENLLMDLYDHPGFVRELLETIADFHIAQVREALRYDIDAVYFGDDWGQQRGLQMGPHLWRRFLRPALKRMYGVVKEAGRYVIIHSCGDVDELFDDLVAIGVDCFNPFQPEVMDTDALMERYRGRLAFHGGLSTQRTLPAGTPEEVRAETRRLIERGRAGGYILAPAHDVVGDVPLANMLAFIETAQAQPRG
jgi:uroporphyrinogen decarboxylase